MTRNQVAEVKKNRFFKSCRSRRELSNALIESFWEAILVEIRPFPFRKGCCSYFAALCVYFLYVLCVAFSATCSPLRGSPLRGALG